MLISAPAEPQFSSNLSAKLRTLPALIDVYVLIVDQVMREHGFDQEKCEFISEQNLSGNERSLETSAHALRQSELFSRYKPVSVACESDLLLAAV